MPAGLKNPSTNSPTPLTAPQDAPSNGYYKPSQNSRQPCLQATSHPLAANPKFTTLTNRIPTMPDINPFANNKLLKNPSAFRLSYPTEVPPMIFGKNQSPSGLYTSPSIAS